MHAEHGSGGHWWTVVTAMFVATVVMAAAVPATLAATGSPTPTVGEIEVVRIDCAAGRLDMRVPVTDLPHIPGDDGYPLYYSFEWILRTPATGAPIYALGYPIGYNPDARNAPFTGDVLLSAEFTPPSDVAPGDPVIDEIFVVVRVAPDGITLGEDGPVDVTSLTVPIDCDEESLAQQLVAVLIRILHDILD